MTNQKPQFGLSEYAPTIANSLLIGVSTVVMIAATPRNDDNDRPKGG